jgi:glycosyltransferase involved in cell wall biosynthesis
MDQSRRKKVFFVLGSFKLGGTERTCSRVGMELLRRGYQVKYILLNGIFDYDDRLLRENSVVLVKDKTRNKFVRLISAYWLLLKILRKEKPDFLVSFSMGFNLFTFFTFYKTLVFRIESNIFIYKRKLYRRYFQNLVCLAPNVKRIVIPSLGLFERSLKYFYRPEKLILVPNPIDIDEVNKLGQLSIDDIAFLKNASFVVTAGRLHASKGYAPLIKAFAKSRLTNYKLVILGEGPQKAELEQLITSLNLQHRVWLGGYQPNPYRFFSKARFFILNSSHESFGNVLIEAMACDTPSLSNDCDYGPRSIVTHNVSGVLYNRDNEEEMIGAMEQMGLDDAFWNSMKEGLKTERNRFNVQKIVDFWEENVLI